MYTCVYVYAYVPIEYTHIQIHVNMYIHIHTCICVNDLLESNKNLQWALEIPPGVIWDTLRLYDHLSEGFGLSHCSELCTSRRSSC